MRNLIKLFAIDKMFGNTLGAIATNLLPRPFPMYWTTMWAACQARMQFMTTAKQRPTPLGTQCLEQTRRVAGQETTLRIPTTLTVALMSASLVRLKQAMPMEEANSGTSLSTNWNEVRCSKNRTYL